MKGPSGRLCRRHRRKSPDGDRCRPFLAAAVASIAVLLAVSEQKVHASDHTFTLEGQVSMTNKRGKPSRLGRPAEVLLFFEPAAAATREETPRTHRMETVGKQFSPQQLVIRRGDRVEFPNLDPILHNVFSVSGVNKFDLEVYGKGEARGHTFEHTGLVRVFCNVHREMFAHLWVTETDYVARPDENGSFRLSGVPAGPGTLTIWHERAEAQQVRVDPANARPLDLVVSLTRPRIPLHNNKFGKRYTRSSEY